MDFVLLEDECSSVMGVFDLKNLTIAHLGKINVKLLAEAVNILYNVNPLRFKAVHFLNVPNVPEALISLLKKLVPQKVIERVSTMINEETVAACKNAIFGTLGGWIGNFH